jgi:hypothetical protein
MNTIAAAVPGIGLFALFGLKKDKEMDELEKVVDKPKQFFTHIQEQP